jgi:hypothetical protein
MNWWISFRPEDGSCAAVAGIQKFKMLARYLTLVPVVDRQLSRRDSNQRDTRTRPEAGAPGWLL